MDRGCSLVPIHRFAAIIADRLLTVDATQIAMFQAGAGVAPGTLLAAIASMVIVLAFIWVIWVTLGTFRAWYAGEATVFELIWSALRASIILMVLGFYLR